MVDTVAKSVVIMVCQASGSPNVVTVKCYNSDCIMTTTV